MFTANIQSATKAMEVLEKLAEWAGNESSNYSGSSGSPSEDLVRAFKQALEQSEKPNQTETEVKIEQVLAQGPAESMPPMPQIMDNLDTQSVKGKDLALPKIEDNAKVETLAKQVPDDFDSLKEQKVEIAKTNLNTTKIDLEDYQPQLKEIDQEMMNARQEHGSFIRDNAMDAWNSTVNANENVVQKTSHVAKAPLSQDQVQELLELMQEIANNQTIQAPQLFRMQYLVGMLNVQTKIGLKVSQNAGQSVENILRQSG